MGGFGEGRGGDGKGRGRRSRTPHAGGEGARRGKGVSHKRPASRGPHPGEAVPPGSRGRGKGSPAVPAAAAAARGQGGKDKGKGGKGKNLEAVPKFAPGPRVAGRKSGEAVPPGESAEGAPQGKFTILSEGVCVRIRWPGTIANTFPPAGSDGSWSELVDQCVMMGCSALKLRQRGKTCTLMVLGPQSVAQSAFLMVVEGARKKLGRRGIPSLRLLHVNRMTSAGVGEDVPASPASSRGSAASTLTCGSDITDEEEGSQEAVPSDEEAAPSVGSTDGAPGEAVPPRRRRRPCAEAAEPLALARLGRGRSAVGPRRNRRQHHRGGRAVPGRVL